MPDDFSTLLKISTHELHNMPPKQLINITNIENIEKWLINISINQTAVRNHGEGIVAGIRYELGRKFKLRTFIRALKAPKDNAYLLFLDALTKALNGKPGRDKNNKRTEDRITWGAARKCINLLARTVVYNGFMWQQYGIKLRDFRSEGIMDRLEIPLDSYSVKGIIKDCQKFRIKILDISLKRGFTIIGLDEKRSREYQNLAKKAAKEQGICRAHLDIIYWRNKLDS